MEEKTAPKAAAPAAAPAATPAKAEAKAEAAAPAAAPAAAAPAKKKKTGLIVGIIIAIIALCGAGVAAFFLFFNKPAAPEDAIANTIDAISNGNGVVLNGTVSANGIEVPMNIKFNKTSAEIEAKVALGTISSGMFNGDLTIKGVVKDEKVYLQFNGIKDALGMYASYLKDIADIDGKWYGAKFEELIDMLPTNTSSMKDLTKCYTETSVEDVVSIVVEAYKNNKFIEATKYEGSEVTKKSSDVYKLSINEEKSAAFKKALEENSKISSIKGCMSTSTSSSDGSASYPIYAEFGNGKISRVVVKASNANIDLDVAYQDVSGIEAPSNYSSFETLMNTFSSLTGGMGGFNYTFDDDDDDDDYDFDLDDYDIDYSELYKMLQD